MLDLQSWRLYPLIVPENEQGFFLVVHINFLKHNITNQDTSFQPRSSARIKMILGLSGRLVFLAVEQASVKNNINQSPITVIQLRLTKPENRGARET